MSSTRAAIPRRALIGGVQWTPSYGLAIVLVVLVTVFSLTIPFFFTTGNFLNVARAISINGIVAMGLTALLISGFVDLSVASVMSLTGVVVGQTMEAGAPFGVGLLIGLLVGALAGLLNGALVNGVGLNSIIVTLGALFVWEGAAFLLAGGEEPLVTDPVFSYLGQGRLLNVVPMAFVILIGVFALISTMLFYTKLGSWLYAIGGDKEASRLIGLKVGQLAMFAFVLSGVTAALGGVVLTASTGAILPYSASGLELPIIAAVILGGTSLHGGRGSPVGTLIALALLGVLFNGMTLKGLAAPWQLVVQGAVLIVAVTLDAVRQRSMER